MLARRLEAMTCTPSSVDDPAAVGIGAGSPANDEVQQPQKKTKSKKGGASDRPGKEKPGGNGGGGGGGGAKAVGKNGKKPGLGLSVSREEDFGQWYSELVRRSELIDYYDVSGCYILRPWAYSIWEHIQSYMDKTIKRMGIENCYFPLFVSEAKLNAEKDHVEGFAPEVAWVTRSGEQELECPIAVRPTSETVMYPLFSNWIRSHRDLPMRLNQWCNVVRWEFKHPTPFIRSREFLWQEGHTAFATKEEADEEVMDILDMYSKVYEHLLAVPVVKGVKSEKEKFAGGLYTTTVEAFVPATGRGVQGGTSHCLGQSFANMFNIDFESENGTQSKVWQNSWGMTTRTIGVMIMVHADDKGLVLPPRVAPLQVVVVPIPYKGSTDTIACAKDVKKRLAAADVRVKDDCRDNYSPGWKYNYWELKGVPIRAEIGPRDFESNSVTLVRRDTGAKTSVPIDDIVGGVNALLETIQNDMLARASKERNSKIATVMEWKDFVPALERKMMVLTPWKESMKGEELVKKKSQAEGTGGAAKTLCIPFEQPPLPKGTKCFVTGEEATKWALWGRSY